MRIRVENANINLTQSDIDFDLVDYALLEQGIEGNTDFWFTCSELGIDEVVNVFDMYQFLIRAMLFTPSELKRLFNQHAINLTMFNSVDITEIITALEY